MLCHVQDTHDCVFAGSGYLHDIFRLYRGSRENVNLFLRQHLKFQFAFSSDLWQTLQLQPESAAGCDLSLPNADLPARELISLCPGWLLLYRKISHHCISLTMIKENSACLHYQAKARIAFACTRGNKPPAKQLVMVRYGGLHGLFKFHHIVEYGRRKQM
jgi:hypothetical protein